MRIVIIELKGKEQLINEQKHEMEVRETGKWPNITITISAPEDTAHADDDELVDALRSKYDTLKEKLIYEALERNLGSEEWNKLTDEEKYEKMMEIKLKIQKLQEEGNVWSQFSCCYFTFHPPHLFQFFAILTPPHC